ncbi:MAG TPA: GNAT family N-acetyltransferase [Gaiellaceae bacterium]|nr:GNAT family N-acetyltransferase [Gaiellaceae bacterium]
MPPIEIRPFRRDDRDQLTGLVNAHVAAVIPGITVSVNAVLSQLEREPGEAVTDPWVIERKTLVAIENQSLAAAAHLHRYGDTENIGPDYRDAGSIHWLLFGRAHDDAADALMSECLAVMDGWKVRIQYAGGELPSVATYGVPSCWPHIRDLFVRSGFVNPARPTPYEIILAIEVARLPTTTVPPIDGLEVERMLGSSGTRFQAVLAGESVGIIEVELRSVSDIRSRQFGWADIGNLWVHEDHRRQGIGSWLLGIAADWLRLGGVERLLTYNLPSETNELAFVTHHGFRELVRTERGWTRGPHSE